MDAPSGRREARTGRTKDWLDRASAKGWTTQELSRWVKGEPDPAPEPYEVKTERQRQLAAAAA
jgi:hypothetical protein